MFLRPWKFKTVLIGPVSLSKRAKPLPPDALSLFQWSQISPGVRNETELFVLVTHFSTLKDSPPCSGYFAEACDCLDYTRVRPEGLRHNDRQYMISWLHNFLGWRISFLVRNSSFYSIYVVTIGIAQIIDWSRGHHNGGYSYMHNSSRVSTAF